MATGLWYLIHQKVLNPLFSDALILFSFSSLTFTEKKRKTLTWKTSHFILLQNDTLTIEMSILFHHIFN